MVIGDKFIWEFRGLREIVIPDGFERIWDSQFCDSGIESVTIPASVREICEKAFYNCKRLKSVTFESSGLLGIESGNISGETSVSTAS